MRRSPHARPICGFTLIELMIVVVIIGILAALAIPRFQRAASKAKQSEAKVILKQIYVQEQSYFQERGSYVECTTPAGSGDTIPLLGIIIEQPAYYEYTIIVAGRTFTAYAAGNIDADITVDCWRMDSRGSLWVVVGNDDPQD